MIAKTEIKPTEFLLPGPKDRTSVIGRTGSGKTQFGLWLESLSDFDRRPHVMIDYKGEELIAAIEASCDNVRQIDYGKIPREPGVYILRPLPDDPEIENFLWGLWERENLQLFVDEGYAIPKSSRAFKAILTQGRAKRISVICCTQRPVDVCRYVFSEADFYAVFHLNDERDHEIVERFLPPSFDMETRLPDFNSRWYDVKKDRAFELSPVPPAETIIETFRRKLETKRKVV